MQPPTRLNGNWEQQLQQVPQVSQQVQQVPQHPFVQPTAVPDLGAIREVV